MFPGGHLLSPLLLCALQWTRLHISANCGTNWCLGGDADALKDSGCSTLIAVNALSSYVKEYASFEMGYTADALGCINGRQGDCPIEAKEYMDAGKLVPDDVIINLIKDRILEDDAVNGVMFDGFPRTIPNEDGRRGFPAQERAAPRTSYWPPR